MAYNTTLVSDIPGYPVENLKLENIRLELPGGGTADDTKVVLPEKENAYPEIGMFGNQMPAYAVVARHANGLSIKNLTVTLATPDARPTKFVSDVQNFEEANWKLPVDQDLKSNP